MKYITDTIRRQDRVLDEARTMALLDEAEYGVLSLVDAAGKPYGVPVNYVFDPSAGAAYVHCAPEGRKLDCLKAHPEVSLCVVDRTRVVPGKFTTEYESVVAEGVARMCLSDEEKLHAIRLLLQKLDPDHVDAGMRATQGSFHRLEVVRIDFTTCTGKCKKVLQ